MTDAHDAVSTPFHARGPEEGQAVERILAAAEACFARAGYADTAMRTIAEEAAVSKGLLHYHFQSKEQLFVEVQIRTYQRLAEKVVAAVAAVESGADRGLLAFDALFEAIRSRKDMAVQAELWARAMSNERLRDQVSRLREFMRSLLVRTIERVLGPEVSGLPMDAEAAADIVWATLNGLSIQLALGEAPERVDRAVSALRELATLALLRTRSGQVATT